MNEELIHKAREQKAKMIKEYEAYLNWLFKDEKGYDYKQFITMEIRGLKGEVVHSKE